EDQRKKLADFAEGHALSAVTSPDQLAETLRSEPPDLLYLFCRAEDDALRLGDGRLTPDALRELLPGDTLLFLNACSSADTSDQLPTLGLRTSVAAQQALPPAAANQFGLEILEAFLYRGEALGKALQTLRARNAPLGLLYAAHCPPGLCVVRPAEG